jgi:CHAT domain-containing protein
MKSLPWREQKFLAVVMPETPGFSDLNVLSEVSTIEESVARSGIRATKVLEVPAKEDVLLGLADSSMVHFACHGESDPEDPSNSCLWLKSRHDGVAERLTVRELSRTVMTRAQLAYLSACSTAENSSTGLMDEVITVASSFQLLGFPHVIGTLWQANDDAANDVVRTFYQELVKNAASASSESGRDVFATALHNAVDALRAGKVPGLRRKRNATDNVTAWAPFIYLGC